MTTPQTSKYFFMLGQDRCPMLLTPSKQKLLTMTTKISSEYLQQLFTKFDVFQTPKELPPHRLQDHRIPLKDESSSLD